MENITSFQENVYSVSYLSNLLKVAVENQFGSVRVKGELSGVKRHTSGHLYFTLKDMDAVLDGVSWKGFVDKFGFVPSDGMEVICEGKLTTYAARSKYQMVVAGMTPSGEGALLKILEERRKKLFAEGLFDPARKKPIPVLPRKIGIVTSPTGAVIRDMIHRLQDRCPRPVTLWPVLVQGEGAAQQIADAIKGFNAMPQAQRPDVLIVARGGGSLEDLWAFNEEVVVRAVAESLIPVISAVGHETDTTLIDYAADLRAPTPTAAAEHAVPVKRDLLYTLNLLQQRSMASLVRTLEDKTQRLDDRHSRLVQSFKHMFLNIHTKLTHMVLRSPLQFVVQKSQEHGIWAQRLNQAMLNRLERLQQILNNQAGLLESFSFQGVLKRGFALLRDSDENLITSVKDLKAQMHVNLTLQDGNRTAEIIGD